MPFLTDEANLFVIELTYKVAIDAVEPHLAAHRNFLDQHYQAGHFLASGAKVPRDGGIILATGPTKAAIYDMIAEDPFHQHDLANYDITEFVPSKTANCLK